eukprot:m.146959 g.146959  ORF g.146959 m.146959 type:complete len:356 (-) comp52719_c0_seq2:108-1175(-)
MEPPASPSVARKIAATVKKYLPRHTKSDVERVYKFGKVLGTGNFAEVKLAVHRETNKKYAVKIINKALCAGKEDMIETEIAVLKKVQHKYIVGMLEEFDTPDKLYLILDYVEGGELFDRIVEEGNFTEVDASRIMRQMTEAIQYLHELGIVHRDLKPENLLFATKEPQSDILVTDFGLAKLIDDQVALKTACGTPNYVAPEILLQKGYGKQVDVWSLGVILFILLCGYPPFYDENDAVLFEMIMKGKFDFDDRYWHEVSADAKDIIRRILVVNPTNRFTTQQILAHPWITGQDKLPRINLSKSISMNLKKKFSVTGVGAEAGQEASALPAGTATTTTAPAQAATATTNRPGVSTL